MWTVQRKDTSNNNIQCVHTCQVHENGMTILLC